MAAPKGNLFAIGNNGGRPPLYENPDDIWNKAELYFESVTSRGKIKATVSGLSFALGFESRQSFYDYEKNEEFSYIIKRLRLFIENCYETQLYSATPSGVIFALKNMGWKDKTETESEVKMKVMKADIEVINTGVLIAGSESDVDV
jgi:hypothetical protein